MEPQSLLSKGLALEGDSTPGTWQQGLGTGCTLGQGVSGLVTKGES